MTGVKAWICVTLAISTSAFILPEGSEKRYVSEDRKAGYLGAFFHDDNEAVYLYTSTNADPLGFEVRNRGQPVLVPTIGTTGVRDPSLVVGRGCDKGKYFIIGTDLKVSATNWDAAVRTASRGILVWESTNLVNWTGQRLPIVENDTAGMVWAPDAIWDDAQGQYFVHWASRLYSPNDPQHTGTAGNDQIRYAYTKDFRNFTTPTTWLDGGGTIDMNILPLHEGGYSRCYKNETASLVYQQISHDGLFGDWQNTHAVNSINTEGPAQFWDNVEETKAHLLLDFYQTAHGYLPLHTDVKLGGAEGGVWIADVNSTMPPLLKHGSVMSITQTQLDTLVNEIA